tara:strand:- start:241 stop:3117 length:2877 start_codon:yes stop_codon:yes gene_type:complete
MTSLGQYASGRTIECELLKASKIEGEIDIPELNTQSVSLEDKWKIYLDENDSFIIKNEIQNVISLTADGLTGDVTLHGSGGGGAENLTDLQDVCATALNGQMFYYNQVTGKYEFTNNITNNETNSTITIPNLNVHNISPHICSATQIVSAPLVTGSTGYFTTRIISPEISCNEINTLDISTQLLTIDNGGIYSETILNYNNTGANYIRGQNFEVDVLSIHLNGTNNGVEIINNSTNIAATRFNKNNTGENEINGNTTIANLVSQEISCNEISCNEISCNILNYNTLNPPISISTNLTDLQDVCATALDGEMFYYNATTNKYEFTNNIKNKNSKIIINDLSLTSSLVVPDISANEISCNILNYNTLNPPINPVGATNLTDLQDVCGVALNGDMFFYNATTSKYEFTNNIKNDTANNHINILDLHIEALGTSSATNKIIVNTNLDLSNNSLISTDVSCETINTRNINNASNMVVTSPIFVVQNSATNFVQLNHQNLGTNNITGVTNNMSSLAGGIHLDAFGTGQAESGIRIKNRGFTTNHSDTIFNQYNTGENHIRGSENHINSFTSGLFLNAFGSGLNSTIKMNAEGTGTNSGVQIVNGAGGNGSTFFNYDNSGENYIRGRKLDVVNPEIILSAEETTGLNDGFIRLFAQGTGTNSGVQIRNGVGNDTIFNYQNSASNFIHGETRFFNDIHIQKIIDASASTGNYGAVLMSEGTGTNKWSNNPSLPNYLYMGGVNVGLSGQVLVSQHTGGFPTWKDTPAYNDTTKTLEISGNATYYGYNSVSIAGGNYGINFFSGTIHSSNNALFFDHTAGTFSPTSVRDGVYSLGSSPRRWSTIYATNGTINTSDDRLKINEKPITGALKLINNLEYYEYDKVKTLDGTDITHKERGVIAQQLINTDISFILSGGKTETIKDPIATETKYIPYGVKYNDLFVTLCSAVKELSQLNKSLEARLLALESK